MRAITHQETAKVAEEIIDSYILSGARYLTLVNLMDVAYAIGEYNERDIELATRTDHIDGMRRLLVRLLREKMARRFSGTSNIPEAADAVAGLLLHHVEGNPRKG